MISEWELWACANHFIQKHGANASLEVTMRADELLAKGDLEGMRTFRAIADRIDKLLEEPQGTLD